MAGSPAKKEKKSTQCQYDKLPQNPNPPHTKNAGPLKTVLKKPFNLKKPPRKNVKISVLKKFPPNPHNTSPLKRPLRKTKHHAPGAEHQRS